jgi:hypothetical protein
MSHTHQSNLFIQKQISLKGLGQRMVMLMSVLYFFASLAFAFGDLFIPKENEKVSGMCKFQAWSIQIMVAAVIWNGMRDNIW